MNKKITATLGGMVFLASLAACSSTQNTPTSDPASTPSASDNENETGQDVTGCRAKFVAYDR